MLSLKTCQELKAIGLRQGETTWYWGGDDAGRFVIFDDRCTRSTENRQANEHHDYDCPNSDELIIYLAGKYGYTCWQDVVTHMELRVPNAENDLCQGLAELAIIKAKETE